MKKAIVLCLSLAILATAARVSFVSAQNDPSLETFWTKFKTAVVKGDKTSVAAMSQFPIGMPYGVPAVKTSAQLIKRYRQVFNGEANAAKCFGEARPVIDPDNRKRFTVGCKNAAGDEVIVYSFVRTKAGWKFKSLDNINE
jgi:hypothetical protein